MKLRVETLVPRVNVDQPQTCAWDSNLKPGIFLFDFWFKIHIWKVSIWRIWARKTSSWNPHCPFIFQLLIHDTRGMDSIPGRIVLHAVANSDKKWVYAKWHSLAKKLGELKDEDVWFKLLLQKNQGSRFQNFKPNLSPDCEAQGYWLKCIFFPKNRCLGM